MRRATILVTTALVLIAVAAAPAMAQSGVTRQAFQTRFGWFFPSGGGELWDQNEEVFTMKISDFNDFQWGFTWAHALNNTLELGVNFDLYHERVLSSYRDFVDERGRRIYHDTILDEYPLTVDLRVIPGGRFRQRPQGRSVVRPVFYFGGGAGINFWEYEEVGDFLNFDFNPPVIFSDRFRDSGEALTLHVLAGVELPVSSHFNFVFEGRHSWSDDELGGRLTGLGNIELGGFSGFLGMSFRY